MTQSATQAAGEPLFRGLLERGLYGGMEERFPQDMPEIWDRLPRSELKLLQQVDTLDWVPMHAGLALRNVAREQLGHERLCEFAYHHFDAMISSGRFASMAKGLIRLFGLNPRGVLKAYIRAWATVTRDLGRWELGTLEERRAELRFCDVPDAARRSLGLRAMHQGSLRAVVEVASKGATAECEIPEDDGPIVWHLGWDS